MLLDIGRTEFDLSVWPLLADNGDDSGGADSGSGNGGDFRLRCTTDAEYAGVVSLSMFTLAAALLRIRVPRGFTSAAWLCVSVEVVEPVDDESAVEGVVPPAAAAAVDGTSKYF